MTSVDESAWAKARADALDEIPQLVQHSGLPSVLLPYQSEAIKRLEDRTPALFIEKSRRIGMTWGLAAFAVLRAGVEKTAGGMDVMYVSYSREMTREFIDACAMWARAFDSAAQSAEEVLFEHGDGDKAINAFRIKFASGFEIIALSSSPRGLRGKQGVVIIDEAAFVDDLAALLKSAMAFLMWGGQVVVCSTHNGADNPFNTEIQDIHAGRSKYAHMRVDLDEALKQGLYQRICLTKGEEWSAASEAAFRQSILNFYRDNADEELYCIPSQSTGAWLPMALIEARMSEVRPVLRLELPRDYLHLAVNRQVQLMTPFMEDLSAQLEALDVTPRFAFGSDFARVADLTTGCLLAIEQGLKRREVLSYELRGVPGHEQKRIAKTVLTHVRARLIGAAFDATGMGWTVAEDMGRIFGLRDGEQGSGLVMAVHFSEAWYRENMPPLKAAFEDDALALIRDADHLSDLRAIKLVRGIARVPPLRQGETGKKRHGDHAISIALAHYASRMAWAEYEYQPCGPAAHHNDGPDDDEPPRAWWTPPLGARIRGSI